MYEFRMVVYKDINSKCNYHIHVPLQKITVSQTSIEKKDKN